MRKERKLYAYKMTHDTGFAPNPYFGVCTLACCKPRIRRGIANHLKACCKNKIKAEVGAKSWSKADCMARCNEYLSSEHISTINDVFDLSHNDKFDWKIEDEEFWVAGFAGKYLSKKIAPDSLVYLMKVTDIMSFTTYWESFKEKRPHENFFLKQHKNPALENKSYLNCGDNIYDINDKNEVKRVLRSFHYVQDTFDKSTADKDLSGECVLLSRKYRYFGEDALNMGNFELKSDMNHNIYNESDSPIPTKIKDIMDDIETGTESVIGRPIQCHSEFKGE